MIQSSLPKQAWFAVAMAIALVILVAVTMSRQGDVASIELLTSAREKPVTAVSAKPTPSPKAPAVVSDAPIITPEAQATRTPTDVRTAAPYSLIPTVAPYVGPKVRETHFWMIRPIAPEGNDRVARHYPYASRLDGSYPVHHGVEFVNPMGTPIRAVADGTIIVAGDDQRQVYGARDGFYGNLVILQLKETWRGESIYALYGHLSDINVVVGQRVLTGEVIGLVGESGVAEGPHVHFEVRVGANAYENTVCPELWVEPLPGHGALAGVLLDNRGALVNDEVRLILTSADGSKRYETTTYPASMVNPDPAWQENFCIGDLPAGAWNVQVFYNNRLLEEVVQIVPGEVTWLELR